MDTQKLNEGRRNPVETTIRLGCFTLVFLVLALIAFLSSIMIANNIKSHRYQKHVEKWLTENDIDHGEFKRDYGNLLWNGNKCMTALMFKPFAKLDEKALRIKLAGFNRAARGDSDNESAGGAAYSRRGNGYWNIPDDKIQDSGETVLGDEFDLPKNAFQGKWMDGETVLLFTFYDYGEWATSDPRCQ